MHKYGNTNTKRQKMPFGPSPLYLLDRGCLRCSGGHVLARAALNWIAVIIHWETDAFQGQVID